MERKLVVLGIPWDVDTNGLKEYMIKFGELEDCIVMKERNSGRSRGFGYVTFVSEDDAKVQWLVRFLILDHRNQKLGTSYRTPYRKLHCEIVRKLEAQSAHFHSLTKGTHFHVDLVP